MPMGIPLVSGSDDTDNTQAVLLNDGVGLNVQRIYRSVVGFEVCVDDWECEIAEEPGEMGEVNQIIALVKTGITLTSPCPLSNSCYK
jgi:hypothetical protein